MKRLPVLPLLDHLENATVLDPLVNGIRGIVTGIVRPQWLRDVLHGVPLGHPLHPLAVQVPLGAWTSAALLDAVPGSERAARMLVAAGVVSALPSAAAGYTDWSQLHEQQSRVGLVHSAANLLATVLYTASFVQRVRGRGADGRGSNGKALGYLAFGVVAFGGFLGGHLSYRQASGANHAEDVPHRVPAGWHPIGRMDELASGRLEHRMLGEIPLLVLRRGDDVHVLSDVCSHLSGPLHEGELTGSPMGTEQCVVCPWHGSTFSLETGEVVHGPATAGQPKFQTRVSDGILEVLLPGAG